MEMLKTRIEFESWFAGQNLWTAMRDALTYSDAAHLFKIRATGEVDPKKKMMYEMSEKMFNKLALERLNDVLNMGHYYCVNHNLPGLKKIDG